MTAGESGAAGLRDGVKGLPGGGQTDDHGLKSVGADVLANDASWASTAPTPRPWPTFKRPKPKPRINSETLPGL